MLTFAARRIRFGKHNLDGTRNPEAWRKLGFDIDGRRTRVEPFSSDPPGSGHCIPAGEGATPPGVEDGEDGIDNAFGAQVFPLLNSLVPSALGFENDISEDITLGSMPTLLFVMDDVNDGPDDPYVNVAIYTSATFLGQPARRWDGEDSFQVARSSVIESSLSSPRAIYVGGYLKGHTYVSGSIHARRSPPVFMPIAASTAPLVFQATSSTLMIELDEEHRNVRRATLSLVITPHELEASMRELIELYFCDNEVLKNFALLQLPTLHKTPDLFLEGDQFQDPSGMRPCDALSMAVDLELLPILPLTTVFKGTPLPPPCPGPAP
jgi:hypothetical protein